MLSSALCRSSNELPTPSAALTQSQPRLVAVRTAEVVPGPELSWHGAHRNVVAGPSLVELPGATCWVPDGWSGKTNDDGTLVLRR